MNMELFLATKGINVRGMLYSKAKYFCDSLTKDISEKNKPNRKKNLRVGAFF